MPAPRSVAFAVVDLIAMGKWAFLRARRQNLDGALIRQVQLHRGDVRLAEAAAGRSGAGRATWERNAVGGCRLSGHRRAGCPLVAVGRRSSRGMGSQVPICGWPRACFVPAWVAGAPSLPPPESSLGSPFYERVTERCRAEQVKSQERHHADQMLRFPVGRGSRRRQ